MNGNDINNAFHKVNKEWDEALARKAIHWWCLKNLRPSSAHWEETPPNGSEVLIKHCNKPGVCVICCEDFPAGTALRWRSRVACHEECWDKIYKT